VRPSVPEANVVVKDWRRAELKVALCYPSYYRVGMAGLPVRLLYALFNSREDVVCERFFLPGEGLETPMPLSLESGRPLPDFDVIAFTLQYEWDYLNVVRMLLSSGIKPDRLARAREGGPIVVAGGPCAVENPLPMSKFVDVFAVGEAEALLDPLVDGLKEVLSYGRRSSLADLASVEGLYVPSAPRKAKRVWVKRLDEAPVPTAQVIPLVRQDSPLCPPFGRTFNLELTRGCGRGCRFCLIDHITRPRRDRSVEKAIELLDEGLGLTPADKALLIGAGISDHEGLLDVCEHLASSGVAFSVPSIRPDGVSEELTRLLARGGQRRLTIAPDGPTPRLRSVINKCMDDDVVLDACRAVLSGGMSAVKLYFIIGLPGETRSDVKAIAELAKRVADLGFGPKCVHLSINPLVPKPWTPFQWLGMASLSYVRSCLKLVRSELKGDPRITLDGVDPRRAVLQAVLSLGGPELGQAIELAATYGGGLGAWRRALRELGLSLSRYLAPKEPGEPLPWEGAVEVGLNRSWLLREYERSLAGEPTPPCWVECSSCGVCERGGGQGGVQEEVPPPGEGDGGAGHGHIHIRREVGRGGR